MSPVSLVKKTSAILKKAVIAENTEKKNAHAEQNALKKLMSLPNKKMKNISLLVIRITKTGTVGESRPCLHCLSAMERSKLKIKWVYYSTKEGTIVREKLSEMKESEKTYISTGNRHISYS
jgi:cytidine deaminase